MAITIDGATRRITLDSTEVSAATIWSRWVDWHESNQKWPLAFSLVGGIALGGGLFIPPYFFLENDWRVRPMESSHNLTITGNLFVSGGGVPVVSTLGTYQVNVNYTVPVQAQGISTSGGSLTAAQVWQHIIEAGYSAEKIFRILAAHAAGSAANLESSNPSFTGLDNTTTRITATYSAGTRTITSLDGA